MMLMDKQTRKVEACTKPHLPITIVVFLKPEFFGVILCGHCLLISL